MTKTDIGQLVPDLQPDLSEIRRFLLLAILAVIHLSFTQLSRQTPRLLAWVPAASLWLH